MKNRLARGYILAFVLIVLVVVLIFAGFGRKSRDSISASGPRIGVIKLDGVIISSHSIVDQFKRMNDAKNIKAIVFRINSPGGGIAASQEILDFVRAVRDSGKPVVASMASVAASGGYYVALGADTIMANPGTTTGSIGVIAEIPNFSKLMEKLGIQVAVIKSGRFKDTGSPYRSITPKEREYLQAWIDDGYDQFIKEVSRERGLPLDSVRKLADGRVYSGAQAFQLGLIDTLGGYRDAINLAADMAGFEGEPKTVTLPERKITLFDLLTSDVRDLLQTVLPFWPRIQYKMSL
ncbi:MAG: signal peptide peptidase SppA [candidate division KSB1 bacterium]|nr:signal peptide peptidase SppA [candidate division KSB1 bacterium]